MNKMALTLLVIISINILHLSSVSPHTQELSAVSESGHAKEASSNYRGLQPNYATSCKQEPRIKGTIIQPWLVAEWTEEQWKIELHSMKQACIEQLVIQWVADSKNKSAFYPASLTGYKQTSTADILNNAFAAAKSEGIDVYLGLQSNGDWWDKFANDVKWLESEADESNRLAKDVWDKYHNHPGFKSRFKGWYLWFEVDNANFPSPSETSHSWDNMSNFYKKVGDYLHTLTPGKPVVISPFYNLDADPTPSGPQPSQWLREHAGEWQEMLTYILSKSSIDILALQDSVGASEKLGTSHATVNQLPIMFDATIKALKAARPGMQLWANSETYIERRPGIVERKPMALRDLLADMRAVRSFVSNYISFSFNHYMSPQQSYGAYYEAYRKYAKTGEIDSTAPAQPLNLQATPGTLDTITLKWTASTDNVGVAGYKIYKDGELIRVLLQGEADFGTSFVDKEAYAGDSFTYYVVAFDGTGNDSVKSNVSSASIPSS